MGADLQFEKPILELRKKISELKQYTKDNDVDLTAEIVKLESRLAKVETEVYSHMTSWDRVQVARHPERPTTLDYIPLLFTDFMELHGDRRFGDDAAIVGGIARYKGMPVTVIGHQRGKDTKENLARNFGMPHPEGYRKALRLMEQANKFKRPIITFIDTKGAYPGKAAEERGQSEAIARNLFEMAGYEVPIICIVIGEGGSGGALGIGVGNRVLMLENSTYSVISPESGAVILWKDASLAKKAAEHLHITSPDLLELGVINGVIPEVKGGAHHDQVQQAQLIDAAIAANLAELLALDGVTLREQRYEQLRKIGQYTEN
ncbi:acetyl-CoA carboxylase carboxyltransferase subunit alpha [Brochothrix campestris]|uniref:Acetyl-coenzyme A carboxylase carboxyl transferase subunit alpha n=1 Tax=Brochothrix campestris FSL F6-1037 TaxID=1265861 RepID=W7CTX2_9LIST|nr:acetyl-CoA carboxylase carboxyltransferase subunit alpha [Brochothrix campestris]EUJ40347.1 acetyl-CoA carboxylase carboxyltransferase subunit alpha [Brochothrix campestris FSL F6-1037]